MVDCTEVATSLNSYKPLVSLFNFVFADFSDRVAFCHQTAIFYHQSNTTDEATNHPQNDEATNHPQSGSFSFL